MSDNNSSDDDMFDDLMDDNPGVSHLIIMGAIKAAGIFGLPIKWMAQRFINMALKDNEDED